MVMNYTGRELIQKNIKSLKLTYGEDSVRNEENVVEVNDLIIKGVHSIAVETHKDINKVLLVFKNGIDEEVARIKLFSTSEISIDHETGKYEILK